MTCVISGIVSAFPCSASRRAAARVLRAFDDGSARGRGRARRSFRLWWRLWYRHRHRLPCLCGVRWDAEGKNHCEYSILSVFIFHCSSDLPIQLFVLSDHYPHLPIVPLLLTHPPTCDHLAHLTHLITSLFSAPPVPIRTHPPGPSAPAQRSTPHSSRAGPLSTGSRAAPASTGRAACKRWRTRSMPRIIGSRCCARSRHVWSDESQSYY